MAERISSLDPGYASGDLSLFPNAIDDRTSLYEVRNNAVSVLKFGLPYNGKIIVVEDTSKFPPTGLVKIGTESGEGNSELVYYGSKTATTLTDLIRGFAGSVQTTWNSGAFVTNSVLAEHHNSIKDALLKIQYYLGTKNNSDPNSLNGIVKQLENNFLAPKALFRAFPTEGTPPLKVRFQNLSGGHVIRYLWDFGDGTHSIASNPTHTYETDGLYSINLTVMTSAGGQGLAIKNNYINVSSENLPVFFYVTNSNSPAYSTITAQLRGVTPTTFNFVDQTDGDILRRIWVFGDGETYESDDPDEHTTTHQYEQQGEYNPTLAVVYGDQTIKRATQVETLLVL